MKIIISESQYNLLLETKSVSAAQTLIDMAVEDYIHSCGKMKAFQNIQLALCKGFENGTVKLEVTSVEKIENDRFEDNVFYVIHLILYVDKEWMLENSYYEKFETTLGMKIANFLGTFEYYCYIDDIRMNDDSKDNLNESEKESPKNQRLIRQMWFDGYSKEDIQNYTGIDRGEFYTILKDEKQGIDCPEANQIIMDMLRNTNLINKKYDLTKFNYEEGSLEFTDFFAGILTFIYEDSLYQIQGMATPYWDDCTIPIDISHIMDIKTNEYVYDEIQTSVDYELIPKKFNSYQEIIDFMNNDYPRLVIPKIKNSIKYYLN